MPLGELKVLRDGEHVATVNVPKVDLPKLAVTQTSSELEDVAKMRAELAPLGDEFLDVAAKIQLFDADGSEVASAVGHLGQELRFKLSDGLYRLRAHVPDSTGRSFMQREPAQLGRIIERSSCLQLAKHASSRQVRPAGVTWAGWTIWPRELRQTFRNRISQCRRPSSWWFN